MTAPIREALTRDIVYRTQILAARPNSSRSNPTAAGPRRCWPPEGVVSGPWQGAAANAGKHGFRVRKVRKVGRVLGVMTCTPFLTFLTFLTFLAVVRLKKKAGG